MNMTLGYRALFAAVALAGLAGCAQFALQKIGPGESNTEVRQSAGAPSEERTLPDGTKAWYYVAGPGGWTTYRVHFGADGKVADARQVLTDQSFHESLVANKTTRDEAALALGRPGLVMTFPNLQEEVWTYRWLDVTIPMKLDIHFDKLSGALKSFNSYWDPCPSQSLMCMGT
jgi:hypothetical protein